MSGGPIVRTADRADADAVASIYNQSIAAGDATMDTVPVSSSVVLRWMDALSPRENILVLDDGNVLGWGIVKRYSDRPGYAVACETSVYVDRALRYRGNGPRIQEQLLAFARSAGYRHVTAKIQADNAHSIRMHERFGFEMVGIQRRIGHMHGRDRDVAIMQCLLD